MSHPYGAKPLASMAFLDKNSACLRKVRPDGLGILKCLKDESILELLGYLNAAELTHMSMVSRCLYVFSMTSDLWRDLYLRHFKLKSINFIKCWRDTYVVEHINSTLNDKQLDKLSKKPILDPQHCIHRPIKVHGMFSDLLHRLWACHTFDLSSLCPGIFKHSNDISIHELISNPLPLMISSKITNYLTNL